MLHGSVLREHSEKQLSKARVRRKRRIELLVDKKKAVMAGPRGRKENTQAYVGGNGRAMIEERHNSSFREAFEGDSLPKGGGDGIDKLRGKVGCGVKGTPARRILAPTREENLT